MSEYSSGAESPVTSVTVSDQTVAAPVVAPVVFAPDLDVIEDVFCPPSQWRAAVKRVSDILIAGTLFFVLSPFFLAISAVLALRFRRSPFFSHERVGRDGELFNCLKFRTMRDPEPHELAVRHPAFKDGTGTRTTRLTSFLRRTSLDELPQLLNVISGEMSLVGPRPVVPEELRIYFGDYAPLLLTAKPGMTGLWTVNGRSDVPYPERSIIELRYVTRTSLRRDASILARTVIAVFGGRGAL